MKTLEFRLLDEETCCAISAGMSRQATGAEDWVYALGKIMGMAARVLYDLGNSIFKKKVTVLAPVIPR